MTSIVSVFSLQFYLLLVAIFLYKSSVKCSVLFGLALKPSLRIANVGGSFFIFLLRLFFK
ncbi:MAG: hypothetical protein ACI93N_000259 [Flavobacteriaceae bacterium]|jgi:hypothetical protein